MTTIKAELINAERFTEREAEIARLVCEGLADKTIARVLAISIKTVSAHTDKVYEKLGLRSQSINTRCTAIVTMIARGMVRVSLNCVFLAVIFSAVQVDDSALRVRSVRFHSISRRNDNNA